MSNGNPQFIFFKPKVHFLFDADEIKSEWYILQHTITIKTSDIYIKTNWEKKYKQLIGISTERKFRLKTNRNLNGNFHSTGTPVYCVYKAIERLKIFLIWDMKINYVRVKKDENYKNIYIYV